MNDDLKQRLWEMITQTPYPDSLTLEEIDEMKKASVELHNEIMSALDESTQQQIQLAPKDPHNWSLCENQIKVELVDHCGSDQSFLDAARVSTASDRKETTKEQDLKLAKFLLSHGHTSPFEHASASYRLFVPIFVARQIMRHRTFSYNEISRRYTEAQIKFYLPTELHKQHKKRLQCASSEKLGPQLFNQVELKIRKAVSNCHLVYQEMLDLGIAREEARMVLPQNLMTTFYMTGNVHNWARFLKQRCDPHAQRETRMVANAIKHSLSALYPDTFNTLKELELI